MDRAESLKVINAFISELSGPAVPPATQPRDAKADTPTVSPPPPTFKQAAPAAPETKSAPPSINNDGLGVLMAGCSGFEIGTSPKEPLSEQPGTGSLIQGCTGFEIGSPPREVSTEPAKPEGMGALIQGCKGFEVGASAPVTSCQPEETTAPLCAPVPKADAAPDAAPIRKALSNLGNKPLLLSLLQYYSSEAQRSCPNRSMLKTTKEQIMKNWPPLVFTPLINALDAAAG